VEEVWLSSQRCNNDQNIQRSEVEPALFYLYSPKDSSNRYPFEGCPDPVSRVFGPCSLGPDPCPDQSGAATQCFQTVIRPLSQTALSRAQSRGPDRTRAIASGPTHSCIRSYTVSIQSVKYRPDLVSIQNVYIYTSKRSIKLQFFQSFVLYIIHFNTSYGEMEVLPFLTFPDPTLLKLAVMETTLRIGIASVAKVW